MWGERNELPAGNPFWHIRRERKEQVGATKKKPQQYYLRGNPYRGLRKESRLWGRIGGGRGLRPPLSLGTTSLKLAQKDTERRFEGEKSSTKAGILISYSERKTRDGDKRIFKARNRRPKREHASLLITGRREESEKKAEEGGGLE